MTDYSKLQSSGKKKSTVIYNITNHTKYQNFHLLYGLAVKRTSGFMETHQWYAFVANSKFSTNIAAQPSENQTFSYENKTPNVSEHFLEWHDGQIYEHLNAWCMGEKSTQ